MQEESPSLSPRGEAQGQQPPQLEEDQRAWQRLEQLILGQVRSPEQLGPGHLGRAGSLGGDWKEVFHPVSLPPFQLEELKQQLEHQEEELGQLRLGVVRLLDGGWTNDPRGYQPPGES